MNPIISLRQITEERLPLLLPDDYQFAAPVDTSWRKWKTKLARWAFGMLKRHGFLINAIGEQMSYKVAHIDQRDVIETLYNSGEIAPYVLDRGLERVYMGREDFDRLIRHPSFAHMASPMASQTHREFMGIKITVLPWIEGIVPVPKGY